MSVEQFIEKGASYDECLQKVQRKYGDRARVMNYRSVRIGGLFGRLFARDGVEVTGYVSMDIRYGGYGKIRVKAVSKPDDVTVEL
jgi:flagellar biosynthesis protein FlhF